MRFSAVACLLLGLLAAACGPDVQGSDDNTGDDIISCNDAGVCDVCTDTGYIPCNADCSAGEEVACPEACAPGLGCATECQVADEAPSNVGCEFWAVDLDQQDGFNDPASAPWGVVMSNVGDTPADVVIEMNTAAVGQPVTTQEVWRGTVAADALSKQVLPTRELDCGTAPNVYTSPGTCLSSRAYRITSTQPIVVYQFNVFTNTYSNDASLLLPTNALGKQYRNLGWGAGHPIYIAQFGIIDRSYVTIVGVTAGTHVHVRPSWKIKGNAPINATAAGGDIDVVLGPFDVLNLETDDGAFSDDAKTIADLSGSLIEADAPVAVFSGVESTGAPGAWDVPKPPGWADGDTCCLDHLEDQLFPMSSVGMHYVITRSPVRSTGSSWQEPDILRFVGVAEAATVTTSLPAPFDSFTIQPGEVKTTWTQSDITVTSTKPVMVGQILVSNEYLEGTYTGDPSLTVYPPVEQYRTEYLFLTPDSWDKNYVVMAAEVGSSVTIDGAVPTCVTTAAGTIEGVAYESRRCLVNPGAHRLSGDKPFGIIAYGYGTAGSYAFAGGADVEPVYEVPPIL